MTTNVLKTDNLTKSYDVDDDIIIFDNGNDLHEASVEEVINNLVAITGNPIEQMRGKFFEFSEFGYDDLLKGEGQTDHEWFECDVNDVEEALLMSNYKILQP